MTKDSTSPLICRACGTENRPNRLFCSNCGGYLQADGEDTWEELPPPPIPTRSVPEPPPWETPPPENFAPPAAPPAASGPSGRPIPPMTYREPGEPEWAMTSAPRSTRRRPDTKRRRSRGLGVFLLLLFLAVAGASGLIVYRTVIAPPPRTPAAEDTTTTESATTSTSELGTSSTTSTEAPPTTLAQGEPITPVSVKASSTLSSTTDNSYAPENLLDGDLSTAWQEGAPGPGTGEKVRFLFESAVTLARMEIANGYQKDSRRFQGNPRVESLRVEYSDGSTEDVRLYDDMGYQEVSLSAKPTEWVRLTILSVYPGDTWEDASISEVRFYQAP